MDYARSVYEAIRATGIRTELDERGEKIGYKIPRGPAGGAGAVYAGSLGAQEVEAGNVTFRNRDTGESTSMSLEEFIAKVQKETKERV